MKIAILGYGVEGKSIEKYFTGKADITIFDNFKPADLPDLSAFDLVFRTPSVNPNLLKHANLSSITDYFFDHVDLNHVIGVTGTKGKGTTCSLTTALLKALGYHTYLVGNIGTPALDILDEVNSQPDDHFFIIYEMSSFQLWTLQKSPHVAVVLRISPDHLDVHKDFAEYVAAKSNITKRQSADDFCIFYSENPDSRRIAECSKGTLIPYPSNHNLDRLLDNLRIPGAHNRENAEAALNAVAAALKTDLKTLLDNHFDVLAKALHDFEGLPHRIQFIRELNGVKYYDDNYSSALPAAEVAIKAFEDRPVVLIAGGKDRNLNLSNHKKAFFESKNIKKVILIGETKEKLAEGQPQEKYEFATDLKTAVLKAKTTAEGLQAKDKPVVLMSPGAASFDMFKNFNDRGDQFQAIVKELN